MKILDCTLRDGGYYNSWSFDQEMVSGYLNAMAEARVDFVELGLRNYTSTEFKGPFYFTTDSFLSTVDLPVGPDYGVMIDAKTILKSGKSVTQSVYDLFQRADDSKISFVRIACHYQEVIAAEEIFEILKELGYRVIINLMQISLRTTSEIENLSKSISSWSELSALYFADSLGNMDVEDVRRVVDALKLGWEGELGIHAHNNMGKALSNTLEAQKLGVSYLDATVSGMGRGAGNTETELLLAELQASGRGDYSVAPLSEILIGKFYPMKEKMGWGASLSYYLAARYGVHPMYIQKIMTDMHFGMKERVDLVSYIPNLKGKAQYDEELLTDLLSSSGVEVSSLNCPVIDITSFEKGENTSAILIAGGNEAVRHAPAIKYFINENACKVFAINEGVKELNSLVDAYVVSHNTKKIDLQDLKLEEMQKVIIPLSRFSHEELNGVNFEQLINFPMEVVDGFFSVAEDGAKVPFNLTAGYALAITILLGFDRVYMVGFDGYGYGDVRQKEMAELLHLVRNESTSIDIVALTHTTYPIAQSSIYAPVL
jgi:4-hydroxy 2-oxovalerate aldolase